MPRSGSSRGGRPRKEGERYPSGQLKPPGPNERVIALRTALLTGGNLGSGPVDITKAENALDLALVRGWITEDRHRGAHRYAGLFRRAMGKLPSLRVAKPLSDRVGAPSALKMEDVTLGKSGVLTPEDHALIAKLGRADISERERTLALKAHRSSHIDWSRLSARELTEIFDAALETGAHADYSGQSDEEADLAALRFLWTKLRRDQASELFSVCVLGEWPRWITLRIAIRAVIGDDARRQSAFESGIDIVCGQFQTDGPKRRRHDRTFWSEDQHDFKDEVRAEAVSAGPMREESFLQIVTEDGVETKQFEVIKRARRRSGQ